MASPIVLTSLQCLTTKASIYQSLTSGAINLYTQNSFKPEWSKLDSDLLDPTPPNKACTGRGYAPRFAARFAKFRAIISASLAASARRYPEEHRAYANRWALSSRSKGKDIVTIKAICFDADGVVVNPQMQFSKHLKREHGISPEMTRSFFNGIFNDCLVGKANLSEVLPNYLQGWNWKGSVDEFIATWLERDHVIDLSAYQCNSAPKIK